MYEMMIQGLYVLVKEERVKLKTCLNEVHELRCCLDSINVFLWISLIHFFNQTVLFLLYFFINLM